jgi:hypothetical protein
MQGSSLEREADLIIEPRRMSSNKARKQLKRQEAKNQNLAKRHK